MEELLRCENVEISFSGRAVVRGVSFTLRSGEILGVAGESGSGKTTLLKALMGLLENGGAVTGGIWFRGRDIPALPERELCRIRGAEIGMVFQDSGASFCPVRTVGDQIHESMAAHAKISKAEAREKALQLFEKLRFKDPARVWDSYPFELSGGMSQRAGIAAAMLLRPSVLLADEPTSALDAAARRQTLNQIRQMRDLSGAAVVLVSHDIGAIRAVADTVLVLRSGRVMEYGPAEQVLGAPQNEYTKLLLAAEPKLRRP